MAATLVKADGRWRRGGERAQTELTPDPVAGDLCLSNPSGRNFKGAG